MDEFEKLAGVSGCSRNRLIEMSLLFALENIEYEIKNMNNPQNRYASFVALPTIGEREEYFTFIFFE